jgi:hypothetical protein
VPDGDDVILCQIRGEKFPVIAWSIIPKYYCSYK